LVFTTDIICRGRVGTPEFEIIKFFLKKSISVFFFYLTKEKTNYRALNTKIILIKILKFFFEGIKDII